MQGHQGERLKKLIKQSEVKVQDLIRKSGIAKGSLYNFYKYPALSSDKIGSVLKVLGVTYAQFIGGTVYKTGSDDDDNLKVKEENAVLKTKVSDLQTKVIELQDELLAEKKRGKTNPATTRAGK